MEMIEEVDLDLSRCVLLHPDPQKTTQVVQQSHRTCNDRVNSYNTQTQPKHIRKQQIRNKHPLSLKSTLHHTSAAALQEAQSDVDDDVVPAELELYDLQPVTVELHQRLRPVVARHRQAVH